MGIDPLYIEICRCLIYGIYYSNLYLSNDEIHLTSHLTLPNTTIKLILQFFFFYVIELYNLSILNLLLTREKRTILKLKNNN